MLTPPIFVPPTINGHRYDHSSIKFRIGATRVFEVQDINYKHSLKPGMVRGTSSKVRGRTRGLYSVEGGFTLYKDEYQRFIQALGQNGPYMEQDFDVVVSYAEPKRQTITDLLVAARVTEDEDSSSESENALVVKATIDVLELVRNGIRAVAGDFL